MARRDATMFLLSALNPAVRAAVERRRDAMNRELAYLRSKENENLLYLIRKGWFEERLHALFLLNSVYQLCIGPLQSSARVNARLGGEIPIHHGADVFAPHRTQAVLAMVNDFFALVAELGFLRDWMTKNTCGDLVFYMTRYERELETM
jgi:hypothetical protein